MRRRDFGGSILGGAIGAGVGCSANTGPDSADTKPVPKKNTRMHVGGDYHSVFGGRGTPMTTKQNLEYNLRHGVRHLTVKVSPASGVGGWDFDSMRRMKDDCERHGVKLEAIRMDSDYIRLRTDAERDRVIENITGNVEKAGRIGVEVITYHWQVIPIRRNGTRPGRGGVTYSSFKLEENWPDLPVGESGRVTSDEYWRRITYFLERVIPVAQENHVKMACHPYDPPGLPLGYQGADNWDSPSVFDGIKRYESIVDSPHNGFQLCVGTAGEGLRDPRTEVLPIVRYLGERGRLHQVHLRNIRGGLNDFAEVFPDEGDMDFPAIMRILRDVQYPGAICPDHMPRHPNDPDGLQAFAFGYGYIKALIQAVNAAV